MTKYLLASPAERAEDQAPAGEPVVPWFPAPHVDAFLGVGSFKLSTFAVVGTLSDNLAVDRLVELLAAQYPGLPARLHENYVVETAVAAAKFDIGTKLRIQITNDSAAVTPVAGEIRNPVYLWRKQPLA